MQACSETIRNRRTSLAWNEILPMPFQSTMRDGESLMGFVLRMANANEVQGIHWLYQELGRDKLNHFKFEDCFAIARTFGIPLAHIEQTMWRRRFVDGTSVNSLGSIKITKPYLIRPLRPQICGQCLHEYGYCRLTWDFQFVCACEEHHCPLIDCCPQCLRYLQWMRPLLLTCNCGFSWRCINPEKQTPDSPTVRLASLFWHKVRPNKSSFAPLDSFEQILEELSVDAISKLIWIFGFKEHADSHIGTGHSQKIWRTKQASLCVERGYLRLRSFIFDFGTEASSNVLDSINFPALKAFTQDTDTAPDSRFSERLIREINHRSDGKYHIANGRKRQHHLF